MTDSYKQMCENIWKEEEKSMQKEQKARQEVTTIANTDTYDHILWLARLSYDQLEIIKELVKDFFNKDWWFNVSSRNARETLMSYANRIDKTKTQTRRSGEVNAGIVA